MRERTAHGLFLSKEPNYQWLFDYESCKNWQMSIRSPKTGELYFRTLHVLLHSPDAKVKGVSNPDDLLKLNDNDVVDLARKFGFSYQKQGKLKMVEMVKTIIRSFYSANNREIKSPYLKVRKVPRSSKTFNRIVPTKEQVYRLADSSMGLRDRAAILFLWQSGLRNSTLRNLKIKHVKEGLLNNEVPLKIDITPDIDKKSLGEGYYTFIDNDGVQALKNYLSTRGKIEDIDSEEPLFLSNLPNAIQPLTDVGLLRVVKRASKRAGIDSKRIWTHCLRASFYNMLVGKMDDTMREFIFGHGIGVRTHYFAPQFVDKVKTAYSSAEWNRTKIVKVEESREEIEVLKRRIQELEHLTDFLQDQGGRLNRAIQLNVQMTKAVENKDPEKLRSLITSPENRPLLETLITGNLVTDDEIRQLLQARREGAKNESENGFEYRLIPQSDEDEYLSLLNGGWENYGQLNGKITMRKKAVK